MGEDKPLELRFSRRRLQKVFLKYEASSHSKEFDDYVTHTGERRDNTKSLKESILATRQDYFSRTTDAFSNLITPLSNINAKDYNRKDDATMRGWADSHYSALEELIGLHQKGIKLSVDETHPVEKISTVLGYIKDQVDDANKLFKGLFYGKFTQVSQKPTK